ncbi:MAG: alpha-glucosidase [Hyphomicrobiales bacterium]|nr:MAG: alpha-glucosidase [Hyphomicrobiales bacterium]
MTKQPTHWWQSATVYQIYPRSFADSNGDGMGDLPGIVSKLDYLQQLGIGVIWLSPIFQSPMADNGYDIADYEAIAPIFGTLEDFDRLIAEAKARGIGILMDLVVNHTSDHHRWFIDARSARTSRYRDFYVWRDAGSDGGLPNDIQSTFGGPAWTLDEASGQYYFHQFAKEQPDLNWENPEVRAEIYAMMNRWLDRGIAGFRMDVINLIAKEPDRGITADGPKLHEYLQEMHRETLAGRDVLTVGESWSATPESALLYSGRDRRELSMVFQFEHVMAQWHETWGKWQPKPFDLVGLKRIISRWQEALADDGWNSLFWGNHDLPRAVSKYGDDKGYRVESAKMLATVLHFLKGTPYVYQGEEIGMTNVPFTSIAQYRDIETLNMHRLHLEAGLPEADFIAGANENGRDNSRTPMQWSAGPNAGFTSGTPWIDVNPNHTQINVEAAEHDPLSILAHYRRLIALRKEMRIIVDGRYRSWLDEHPDVMAYTRSVADQSIMVVANFTARSVTVDVPQALRRKWVTVIGAAAPADVLPATLSLGPFEANVWATAASVDG